MSSNTKAFEEKMKDNKSASTVINSVLIIAGSIDTLSEL